MNILPHNYWFKYSFFCVTLMGNEPLDLKDEYFKTKTPFVTNLFKNRLKTAIKLASLKDNFDVIDVGCHTGYLLKMIKNYNPKINCYGIDINDGVFTPIVEGCDLRKADVRNMPFNNESFDILFVTDVLEHVEEIETAINEIKRVLKKGGSAILSGPTETWFYRFCRFLWLGKMHYSGHKHTIYDIERIFEKNSFKLILKKSLPCFPLPELFRITKFQKL